MKKVIPLFFAYMFVCFFSHAQLTQVIAYGDSNANYLGQQGLLDDEQNRIMTGKRFQTNDYPHIGFFDKNNVYQWSFYLNKTSATALKIIQTKDRNYIASFYPGIVLKFNALGNILWYKDFSNVSNWEDMFEDSNGDVYMVATSGSRLLLSKMDLNGTIVWTSGYSLTPVSSYLFGKSIEETYDGNLVVGGVASYLNGTYAKPVLLKLTKSGTIIWSSVFTCPNASMLIDKFIESKNDHGFFGVGYNGTNTTNTFNGLSLKIDSNGNYVNNKSIDHPFHDTYYDVCESDDGGFVAVGMSKPVEVCGGNVFFTKFTLNNDTVFHKVYGTAMGNGAFFFNVQNAPNGGYYSFGTGSLWSSINMPYDYTFLNTDAQLELPCKKFNQSFTQSILTITQDSNVVKNTFTPLFTDVYTITKDTMMAVNACTGQILNSSNIELVVHDLSIIPNPAINTVTISTKNKPIKSITVFAIDGKQIYSTTCNSFSMIIPCSTWSKGTYIVQTEVEQQKRVYSKIQIEH